MRFPACTVRKAYVGFELFQCRLSSFGIIRIAATVRHSILVMQPLTYQPRSRLSIPGRCASPRPFSFE